MSDKDENGKANGKPRARGVFERPAGSGIWWVCYFDENRRKHREKVGPKSLALKVYQKRKNEIQERRFFPERIRRKEVLLSDMIDDYIERNRDRLRWFDHYERYAELWKDALKGKTLREILPGDIERYIAKRRSAARKKKRHHEKPLAPATINRELAFLRRIFNVAIEDGKADTNPVRPKMFTKENNQRVRFLSEKEETALQKAIGKTEWPMVAVAIHTGLRRSEQFNLCWENVDFNTGIITVPRSKHGEARRLPMNDTVREILRSRPSRLKSAYVFPSATGETPLDGQNYVNRVFLPALKAAKVDGFTWHCLRHTFASRLVMKGVDMRTVQELLGHKTLAMTERYSHLSPAHQLDAVQRLNQKPSDTSTDTEAVQHKTAVAAGAEVVDLPLKPSGGARNRTADLGIMRPSL
jgi:integrase